MPSKKVSVNCIVTITTYLTQYFECRARTERLMCKCKKGNL